eukprot:11848035-Karenia_brevis.AAC.1
MSCRSQAIFGGYGSCSEAQSIIVGEDPKTNEYFDPLTAAEKIFIQNGLQSLRKYQSDAMEAYYGLNWETEPG